jgi:putative MFS transporter
MKELHKHENTDSHVFNIDDEEESQGNLITSHNKKHQSQDLLNNILNSMGMSAFLIKMIVFGILTCFADGSEMVVVSLIMRKLETKWALTPIKKAFIGGSIFYGFLLGALMSGKTMDKHGRKFTLVFGFLIFLIFGLASSFATEFYSFMAYRIGVGLGIGFVIPTTQTFITELAPQRFRGFISIIIWLGFPLGEMYICYVAFRFPLDDEKEHLSNWQWIMILAAVPVNKNIIKYKDLDFFKYCITQLHKRKS